ncbi:hypothetical protein EYV94_04265 [Puteibacter caeruleilacunae]|nr:hypothetical protein EYV94_04265 [Puteibacter caeruleilacunae]
MNRSHNYILHVISLVLGLLLSTGLYAQDQSIYKFVKPHVEVEADKMYFNVVHLENKQDTAVTVKLKLMPPKGWRSLAFLPKSIILQPKQKKLIPIRLSIPKTIEAGKIDTIAAMISGVTNGNPLKLHSTVTLQAKHDLTIRIDQKIVHFKSEETTASPSIVLINKGNTTETINFHYDTSREIRILEPNTKDGTFQIASGQDTTLTLRIQIKKEYEHLSFNNAKLFLKYEANGVKKETYIRLIKLQSSFDNLTSANILPEHEVGYIMRFSPESNAQRAAFARGEKILNDSTSIKYDFSTYNLSSDQDFWRDNDLNLSLNSKYYSFGFGSSGTRLGENLYKRNSLFGDYTLKLDSTSKIHGFVNTSIHEQNTGGAMGYELNLKKFSTLLSAGYNNYNEKGINTKSLRSDTRINLDKIFASYQGTYFDTRDRETGLHTKQYEHLLQSTYNPSERMELTLNSDIKLSNNQQEDNLSSFFQLYGTYNLSEKYHLIGTFSNNITKQTTALGDEMNSFQNLYRLQLSAPGLWGDRIAFGPQITQYENTSSTSSLKSDAYNLYIDNSFRKGNLSYRMNLLYGYLKASAPDIVNSTGQQLRLQARISHKLSLNQDYNLTVNYSNEQNPTTGIGGRDKEKKLTASLNYNQSFFRNRLHFTSTANYTASSNNQEQISMNGALQSNLGHNLTLKVRSEFRPQAQRKGLKLSTLEVGVTKGFDSRKNQSMYHDMEILYFKDTNANGRFDKGEEPVDNVQTRVTSSVTRSGNSVRSSGSKFLSTALMSNAEGRVKCKNLNEGSYSINFQALSDLNGYFNFEGAQREVLLDKNKKVLINFVQAAKIHGTLILKRSSFSALDGIDIGNIRVTATDSLGRSFSSLTDHLGNYTLYVPRGNSYTVKINNIFGSKLQLLRNNIKANLQEIHTFKVNFIIQEKKRRINFSKRK